MDAKSKANFINAIATDGEDIGKEWQDEHKSN